MVVAEWRLVLFGRSKHQQKPSITDMRSLWEVCEDLDFNFWLGFPMFDGFSTNFYVKNTKKGTGYRLHSALDAMSLDLSQVSKSSIKWFELSTSHHRFKEVSVYPNDPKIKCPPHAWHSWAPALWNLEARILRMSQVGSLYFACRWRCDPEIQIVWLLYSHWLHAKHPNWNEWMFRDHQTKKHNNRNLCVIPNGHWLASQWIWNSCRCHWTIVLPALLA